jgi:hypothetical protein
MSNYSRQQQNLQGNQWRNQRPRDNEAPQNWQEQTPPDQQLEMEVGVFYDFWQLVRRSMFFLQHFVDVCKDLNNGNFIVILIQNSV